MENINNENFSSCSDDIISSFVALEGILNSNIVSVEDKCSAWRQQSLIVKCLGGNLTENFMDRLWLHHCPILDMRVEFYRNIDALDSDKHYKDFEFPNSKDVVLPSDPVAVQEMFKENKIIENINMLSHKNVIDDYSGRPRNTMENFLKGHLPEKNQQTAFNSARSLLAIQNKELQSNRLIIQQQNSKTNLQKPDVGFNFSFTKKSLGSHGRLLNTSRKNFVSPVRNKSIETADTESKNEENVNTEMVLLLSHPALNNVDSKMVELVNNEIIHKFKPVDWNEIAGLDYAKAIIKEAVVYPLLRPDIFTGLRRPPRGILLFGPPGTGKTLIGKCIASQSSSTFFSISSASLTSKWMGESEKMVRALFGVAIARQPSVIFIDEVDSLLSQRSENENEGSRRLKTEFLVRLDGAGTSDDDRVLIVGATNRPQELDEAVRRRFVKRLYVPLPEIDARAQILTNLLKTVENNLNSSQINEISRLSAGYSGADMDSLCREASMEPLRSLPAEAILTFDKKNLRHVNIDDFHSALKRIRPSVSQSDLNQYMEWNKTYGSDF